MEFFDQLLTIGQIKKLQNKWGDYLKLTIDIENSWLIAGGELHSDGEKLLLDKGSNQDDIWGGGIDLESKQIDTAAVLNLRPRLDNDNLEILDPEKRRIFIEIVKEFFKELWSGINLT